MKKILFSLGVLAFGILSASAQEGDRLFKKFKGDISLGYAAPVNSGSDGGFLISIEPKYALIDKLSVGLRMEVAVLATVTGTGPNGDPQVDEARGFGSYVATADYYFTNNYSFRPFVGAGVGAFTVVETNTSTNDDDLPTVTKFGGLIRAGGEVRHFRFAVEYNIIPSTQLSTPTTDFKAKNGYVGLKVGFCIGGGPLE